MLFCVLLVSCVEVILEATVSRVFPAHIYSKLYRCTTKSIENINHTLKIFLV